MIMKNQKKQNLSLERFNIIGIKYTDVHPFAGGYSDMMK